MPVLATLAELNAHLALTDENVARDALLTTLLDNVEQAFLAACGRSERPFLLEATGVVEVRDGTGSSSCYVDRPIASVVSVLIGADVNAPRETLLASTPALLNVRVGGTLIRRLDGGTFGALDEIAVLHVTYNTQTERPGDAMLAVIRGASAVYLQSGSEDVKSETEGGYRADLAAVWESDPVWITAVAAHRTVQIA